jgi:hypothetical protein
MDPVVMTMVNVMLCVVLVAWFLTREDDLPARPGRGPKRRAAHWRRQHRRWHDAPGRPGAAGQP